MLFVLLLCHTIILCENLPRKELVKRQERVGSELLPEGMFFSNCEGSYVLNFLYMSRGNPIISDIIYGSYGAYVLDHLENFGKNGGIFVIAGDGTPCEYGRNLLH